MCQKDVLGFLAPPQLFGISWREITIVFFFFFFVSRKLDHRILLFTIYPSANTSYGAKIGVAVIK